MSRTIELLFKRLHEAGLVRDHEPEDYTFHSHRLSANDREAGAMRWTMIHKAFKGPVITSSFTARDCYSRKIQEYDKGYIGPEIEIGPKN